MKIAILGILFVGCSQGGTVTVGMQGSGAPPGDVGVFDARSYGAVCDGATDDSAAWQAAIDAAAQVPAGQFGGAPLAAKIVGCMGPSVVKKTLNFTGFSGFAGSPTALGLTVDLAGTCLVGATNGKPVIDALGSRFINWEHLCIWGADSDTPNIGMQIGNANNASADQHNFIRPVIYGNFTFTAFYNGGSETNTFIQPWFLNNYASGRPFALVEDGYNHWNMKSDFITVTTPVDTPMSFNENAFYGGWIGSDHGTPIWLGNVSRHRFIAAYAETTAGPGVNNVILWNEGGNISTDLYLDMHFEANVGDTFLISGPAPSPTFSNFTYHDQQSFAASSLFKLDRGVTSAAIQNGTIQVSWFGNGTNAKVFDAPDAWSFSGDAYVPLAQNWPKSPGQFNGKLCIAGNCLTHAATPPELTFTVAGCAASAAVGSATAGTFTIGATNCKATIAMAGGVGLGATHGWTCQAHDMTRPAAVIGGESASTTTTATLSVPTSAAADDVISFACQPY